MKSTRVQANSALSGRTPLIGIAFLMVIVGGLVADADKTEDDNFYANIIRLEQVATKIHQDYVEAIPSSQLVDQAVTGMLEILDPHTSYFEKKDYEELRIHTEGQFGGLGIQISIRDKVLTVMTPISGTPASRAGIQPGDQIIKIEGKSTKAISIDDAVGKLRGEPGSEVTITIRRKGEKKDLDYTITREIIQIRSVPFAGMLDDEIGYVRLLTFSQDAGDEVEKALRELLKHDVKGIIFDLRFNPGGLLHQAISVSEKFLPKKSLVVSTRGRVRGQNKEFEVRSDPVLPSDIPLVVLVNYASASASEIVAGAIQDWDRGVILGDTTFGKGSVQSILPLDKTHHLKLTTAFYYTPSGRCINKPENGVRAHEMADSANGPAGVATDSAKVDTTVYRTRNGRVVCGGGGIVPDTVVEDEPAVFVIRALFGKDVFFKFANGEYPRLKKSRVTIDAGYVAGDAVMKRFYAYLDSTEFDLQSYAQVKFDEFKKHAGIKDTSDTVKVESVLDLSDKERESVTRIAQEMEKVLDGVNKRTMREQDKKIRKYVSQALLVRELGQDNEVVYRTRLKDDKQVRTAIAILKNKALHASLLEPHGDK